VPSSTFSSEPRRIPAGDWRGTWLVALALALGLLVALERIARKHGQRPTVTDDPIWWSLSRRQVDDDPRVVGFVGTSRMQLAYDDAAFAQAAPKLRGVQLAINGVTSHGVLEDLAADEHFRGVAVVDFDEWDIAFGDVNAQAKPYVERSHALWRAPGALANRLLSSYAQERLAVLAVGGRPLLTGLVNRRWPPPTWVASDRDRVSHADWSLAVPGILEARAKKRLANFNVAPPAPDDWVARALAIEAAVQRIRARGGDVVIVRLPIGGKLAELFEQHYPRAQYWDAFARQSSAHVIHFRDVPALAALNCPDEMHLDQVDEPAFTRGILEAMRARGVLRGRE
jgi:hypothetical protein